MALSENDLIRSMLKGKVYLSKLHKESQPDASDRPYENQMLKRKAANLLQTGTSNLQAEERARLLKT